MGTWNAVDSRRTRARLSRSLWVPYCSPEDAAILTFLMALRQMREHLGEVECPRRLCSDVALVSQALGLASGLLHTERGGAKLEHRKELNVPEGNTTALSGSQLHWISWGLGFPLVSVLCRFDLKCEGRVLGGSEKEWIFGSAPTAANVLDQSSSVPNCGQCICLCRSAACEPVSGGQVRSTALNVLFL